MTTSSTIACPPWCTSQHDRDAAADDGLTYHLGARIEVLAAGQLGPDDQEGYSIALELVDGLEDAEAGHRVLIYCGGHQQLDLPLEAVPGLERALTELGQLLQPKDAWRLRGEGHVVAYRDGGATT